MSFADWVIVGVCSVIVILLGGLPEKVTDDLVKRISTHRPISLDNVRRVTERKDGEEVEWEANQWPHLIQCFNQSIYLGRISLTYLPDPTEFVTLELGPAQRTMLLFAFRNETGVLLQRGRRRLFYFVRMERPDAPSKQKGDAHSP